MRKNINRSAVCENTWCSPLEVIVHWYCPFWYCPLYDMARRVRRSRRRVRRAVRPRRGVRGKKITRRRLTGALAGAARAATGALSAVARRKFSPENFLSGALTLVGNRAGTKRKRGGSRLRYRRNPDEGTGSYNQWSTRYAQGKLARLNMRKIFKNTLDYVNYCWQKISRFGTGGLIKMVHTYNAVASPTYYQLPVMAFELNSCNNWSNGTTAFYAPCAMLEKNISTGNFRWVSVQGQSPTGVSNINWHVEKSSSPQNTQRSFPNDRSIMKWCMMELELNGQRANPTKYTIEVCKFSEEVVPMLNLGTDITDGNYGEFWDSHTKQYTFSPLSQLVNGYAVKKVQILRRYNVAIDPTATFETDARPHVKTFRIFLRTNTKCTYNWKLANPNVQNVADFEDVDFKQEDNENQSQVDPKARIFLIIRASNYNLQTDPAAVTDVNTPMLNLRVRTQHIISA